MLTGKPSLKSWVFLSQATRKSWTSSCTSNVLICVSQRKFKECLKKDGFQLAAGEITPLDGSATPKPAAASKRKKSEVKTEKTPKKAKKSVTKKEEDDAAEKRRRS